MLASTEAIKQAVAAGLGLAVVSRAAAGDQLALGHLAALRITGFEMRRELTELRLRERRLRASAVALSKLLHACVPDIQRAAARPRMHDA